MKRLRETQASSPLLHNVHSLLDAAPALPESRARMLRVRNALDQPRARGGLLRVPAFAAAALIALFGASAFAAVRIFEAIEQPAAQPAPSAAEPGARKARRTAQHSVARPRPEDIAVDSAPAVEPAAHSLRAHAGRARSARAVSERAHAPRVAGDVHRGEQAASARDARRSEPAEPVPVQAEPEPESAEQAPPPPAAASDSELVHRAVKALRRDGDAALAARLLAEHRARSPQGPLAEEALSLQIEAALALRSPRAAALAREYLARYPGGRYTSVAARALREAPP